MGNRVVQIANTFSIECQKAFPDKLDEYMSNNTGGICLVKKMQFFLN